MAGGASFCSNCGQPVHGDERFCTYCGHELRAAAAIPAARVPASTPASVAGPSTAVPVNAAHQPAPPQHSPDGKYWWDGTTWEPVRAASPGPVVATPGKGKRHPALKAALIVAGFVVLAIAVAAGIAVWQYHEATSGPYAAVRTDYDQMIAADNAVVKADIHQQVQLQPNSKDITMSQAGIEKRIALRKAFDQQVKALQFPASKDAQVAQLLHDESSLEQIYATEEADLKANNTSKYKGDVDVAGTLQGATHDDVDRLGTP